MRYYLLIVLTLSLLACAKGDHTGKVWNYEPELGANDPCANTERCEFVEYLSFNDPLIEKKVHRYFPGYQLNQSKLYLYEVGQEYTLNKQGYFNQNFDFETGKYQEGCLVSYEEVRTIYKIIHGLIDDEGDVYTRLVYKYKKANPINHTDTQACLDFMSETWEFEDEDFDSARVYEPLESKTMASDITADLPNANANDFTIHFFVVKVDGNYYIRRTVEAKNQIITITIFNPETRRLEEISAKVDLFTITISHPDENTLGNKYEYTEVMTDGIKTAENSSNLTDLSLTSIDPSEAPDEP